MANGVGTILVSSLIAVTGCAHESQQHATTASTVQPRHTEAVPRVGASPELAISSEIVKRCGLHVNNLQDAPKFDFDEFELLPDDRKMLQQLATCVTNGPLKGRSLRLVGRADPRGTDEYNIALGAQRASSVGTYLVRLGVAEPQISETSYGAYGATGTDELTYRVDRRVDIDLAPRVTAHR